MPDKITNEQLFIELRKTDRRITGSILFVLIILTGMLMLSWPLNATIALVGAIVLLVDTYGLKYGGRIGELREGFGEVILTEPELRERLGEGYDE